MDNDQNKVKTALITGGTNGIGLELAKVFAANGYNLVIVARNEDKLRNVSESLQQAYHVSVKPISLDLSNEQSSQNLHSMLAADKIIIDVLVNNAGFAVYGKFIEQDLEKNLSMMRTNMLTLTALTHLFLNDMVSRRNGKILNVASTAAFQPGPLMATYYATKAQVLSLTEALANEIRGTGVTISALCPGPTKTGFEFNSEMPQVRLFRYVSVMQSSDVAKIAYRGLMRNKTIIIPGFMNKLFVQSLRISPRKLVVDIVRRLDEPL